MKQIKDLPKDWALYLGDKSMPKWKEALDCYNELMEYPYEGSLKYYTEVRPYDCLDDYKKILTPEEFVSHFEIDPTVEDELADMRYEVGDTIINNHFERKVLGVCGLVYFISKSNELNEVADLIFTQQDLDILKYKKK